MLQCAASSCILRCLDRATVQAAAEGVAEVLEALSEAESEGRAAHAGMWEYGDPGSEEDEDAAPRSKGAWGRK